MFEGASNPNQYRAEAEENELTPKRDCKALFMIFSPCKTRQSKA